MNGIAPGTSGAPRRFPRTALILVGAALILIGAEALIKDETPQPAPRRRARERLGTPATGAPDVAPRVAAASPAPVEGQPETPAPPPPRPVTTPPPAPVDHALPEDLALTRIVYDAGDPEATFAVIGDRAFRKGELCGRWLVLDVRRDRVVLEGEDVFELTPK
jgi:hypothetical protein